MTTPDAEPQSEIARLRRLNASLAAYREMSEQLLACITLEQVAKVAVSLMTDLIGAEGGALLLAAEAAAEGTDLWEYSSSSDPRSSIPEEVRRGLLEAVVGQREPVAELDAADFLARAGVPAVPALKNFLALPVRDGARCVGAAVVYNLATPEHLPRYADEAAPLVTPVAYAIAHVRLLEAREREARLVETILENATSHVAYLDPSFNFVRVNSAYVQGCGHSREELIGRNHFDFFPNVENEQIFRRVRDAAEAVEYREKPFEYADQPERGVTYWDWRLTPVKDSRGAVEGLVLSLTDMTERVRTREGMIAAERARAELAETFAAEVSHRMKNHLTIVAGLLHTQIADQPADAPGASAVRQAIARIRGVAAVHEQLFETRAENVELLDAMRRIARIGCEALFSGDVEVSVYGDQVFYPSRAGATICVVANELVTNAIKHGQAEPGGKLRIRINVAPRGDKLHLSVWNSGNPVPRDFDPTEHRGMGLLLVHDIVVRQCKGSLAIRPDAGGTIAQLVVDDAVLRQQG